MVRGVDLTPFVKGEIFALHNYAHFKATAISAVLRISVNTIRRYLRRARYLHAPNATRRANCHRPRVTTAANDNNFVQLSRSNRFLTANTIRNDLLPTVSSRTVSRRLNSAGLKARTPANKTKLTVTQKLRRTLWCNDHRQWDVNMWKSVTFSDESTFAVNRGHRQYVRRMRGERYSPQCVIENENRSMGSVNVWGAFSWFGFTELVRIEGRNNSLNYTNILENNLLHADNLRPPEGEFHFQQDNCPIHTSLQTRNWLMNHNIQLLPWPSVSPDLNPIENCWGILKKRIRDVSPQPHNTDLLFQLLQREWNLLMSNVETGI